LSQKIGFKQPYKIAGLVLQFVYMIVIAPSLLQQTATWKNK